LGNYLGGWYFLALRITLLRHILLNPANPVFYDFRSPRLKGSTFFKEEGVPLDALVDYLSEVVPSEEELFVFPEPIFLHFALDKKIMNPVFGYPDHTLRASDIDTIIESMKNKGVHWAIFKLPGHNNRMYHKFPKMVEYIANRFDIVKIINSRYIVLYRPTEDYRSTTSSKKKFYRMFNALLKPK